MNLSFSCSKADLASGDQVNKAPLGRRAVIGVTKLENPLINHLEKMMKSRNCYTVWMFL